MSSIISILVLILLTSTGCKIESKFLDGIAQREISGRGNNNPPRVISAVKAPLRFRSLVESWIRQADITNNTDINNIYMQFNALKNQLPQEGTATELTSSGFQALFVVAGQVCGALKNKEAALTAQNRQVFKNFNFTPNATLLTREALASDQAIRDAANNLLLVFVGRSASEAEKTEFVRAAAQVLFGVSITAQNNTKAVSDIAVVLCTAVVSSIEAISI
ncbi:MAG: hypothetical protein FJ116_08325 [Deltaproteobacteria bacterium]|nr:hypothetical protein [Deltaproteobacteria bacterium]